MNDIIEIDPREDKSVVSERMSQIIKNHEFPFSSDYFDDSECIYKEKFMEETYNSYIEDLEVKATLTYYYEDYLRNNVTHFNKYYGKIRLYLKAFYAIKSSEYVIYEKSKDIGSFSHSEDAEDNGDPPSLNTNENFNKIIKNLEQLVLKLPDVLVLIIDSSINEEIQEKQNSVKLLEKERIQFEYKLNVVNKKIEKMKKEIKVLKPKLIRSADTENWDHKEKKMREIIKN